MCKTTTDWGATRMLPWWFPNLRRPLVGFLLLKTLVKLLIKEIYIKLTKFRRCMNHPGEVGAKLEKTLEFLASMGKYNRFAVEQCRQALSSLAEQGITKVAVYGANDIAEILYYLSYEVPVKITAIFDECPRRKTWVFPVLPLKSFQDGQEIMIIGAVVGVEETVQRLSRLGVNSENLVLMGGSRKGISNSDQVLPFQSDRGNSR